MTISFTKCTSHYVCAKCSHVVPQIAHEAADAMNAVLTPKNGGFRLNWGRFWVNAEIGPDEQGRTRSHPTFFRFEMIGARGETRTRTTFQSKKL